MWPTEKIQKCNMLINYMYLGEQQNVFWHKDFHDLDSLCSLFSHSESSTFALGNRFISTIGNREFHTDSIFIGNMLILRSHFFWKI